MRTAWGEGYKKNKQHDMTETMGLLLTGIRDGLSKEVTFKVDPNVRKKLAGTSWRNRGTARANSEVAEKSERVPRTVRWPVCRGHLQHGSCLLSLSREGQSLVFLLLHELCGPISLNQKHKGRQNPYRQG